MNVITWEVVHEKLFFFCMISGLGLHITFEPELSGHSVLSGRLSEPRNCYPSFTVIFISTKRSPLWAVAHKYIKWSFMTLNSGSLKFSPLWNLYRAVKLYLAFTTPKYGFYCKCFKNKCHWHVKTLIYSILKIKGWPSFRLDTVLTCTFQNLGELFSNENIFDWKKKGRFCRRYFACS